MSDPVILIGLDKESGKLALVGLYASLKDAQDAIGLTTPTNLHYSVMTPRLGGYVEPKSYPEATGSALDPIRGFGQHK